mmetsp:Transcript_47890/g.145428  ORF Transcript_47890/g.145428 Transcript_47890/m.145428 type:complete len:635 (+) Transcript_47890:69-1973(+)
MTSKWGELGAQMASIVLGSRAAAPAPSAEASTSDFVRQEGVVADWNPRGFGFIHFTDGRRAYVHNSACGGASLLQGQAVTACVAPDPRNPGKWHAHSVERTLSEAADGSGRLQGTVAQWSGTWGFVHFCDGRRAFVHASECSEGELTVGQSVVGSLMEDPKNPGKWQARSVEAAESMGTVEGGEGEGTEDLAQGWQSTAPSESDGGKTEGTVTQWTGSYGFAQFTDGRRAYVHVSQCSSGKPLAVGQTIVGTIIPDTHNPGKWQAIQVDDNLAEVGSAASGWNEECRNDGGSEQWSEWSAGREKKVQATISPWREKKADAIASPWKETVHSASSPWSEKKADGNVSHWSAKRADSASSQWDDQQVDGVVSQWNESGFGYIDLVDGSSVYVDCAACDGQHLTLGEEVSAVIVHDWQKPGNLAAKSIVRKGDPGVECTVTDWRASAGWGFVLLDEGGSAFIHASAFGGGNLTVGMRLRVTTRYDASKGRMAVDEVKGMSAEAGPGGWAPTAPAEAAAPTVPSAPAAPEAPKDVLPPWRTKSAPARAPEPAATASSTGRISEWHSGGFGFAAMDDGRRVYVHNSQCGGQHLEEGEMFTCTVVPDARNPGKWAAQDIQRYGSITIGGIVQLAKRQRLA